jgi:outer membrane protein with beta-barrel domain
MTRSIVPVFILALAVLVPVAALAQQGAPTHHRRDIAVGVKAAPVFVSLSQGSHNWGARQGAVVGTSLSSNTQRRFALVAEGLYERRGASNLGQHARLNILEVPVLVRVNATRSDTSAVYGLAGQALDINLRTAQQKASGINAVDPNLVFGAGVEVKKMTVEARENVGLRTLAPNTPNLKSRSFSVMFGFRLF